MAAPRASGTAATPHTEKAIDDGGDPMPTDHHDITGRFDYAAEARERAERDATERAHRALRNSPDYRERLAIAHDLERAASSASAVGMSLGAWAARGDWATLTENGRTRSGQRALTDLDAALEQLAAVRERLAAALADQHGDTVPEAGEPV